MSYLTVSSKRRHGDEWVQMKCDGCGALGPRVEVTLSRRRPAVPQASLLLARLAAGTAEHGRSTISPKRRRAGWLTVDDICSTCASYDPAKAAQIYRDYLNRTAREHAIAADDCVRDQP